MTTKRFLSVTGTIATATAAVAFGAYQRDIRAAKRRIEIDRQVIDTPEGAIEFAESGNGPAIFVSHGAGGGFDQGLDLGRAFVGFNDRVIAPSRFGYLGTPMPADASPEAQADAHLRLLDALQLDRVAVIGVSAGAPSAMQLCLKHPERCSALVLAVPLAFAPDREPGRTLSPLFGTVLNAITASDVLFWTATKVAHATLLKTILGTPVPVYRRATPYERRNVDRLLRHILPISKRAAGIANDAVIANTLTRYPLEEMRVPTLVVCAADCLYGTYDGGRYTAEQIRDARFVAFPAGGHLLVGHDTEVRSLITTFLKESVEAKQKIAS